MPRNLLTTRVASASPSTSSLMTTTFFRPTLGAASPGPGSRSATAETFFVSDNQGGIVNAGFHPVGVGDEVGRDVAARSICMPSTYSISSDRPSGLFDGDGRRLCQPFPWLRRWSHRWPPRERRGWRTWPIRSRVSTVWDMPRSSSTTADTACSMPRLIAMGLAPAVTFLKPSLIRLWARTMEVVVPSPAASLVLVAASLEQLGAHVSQMRREAQFSLAMVTPSLQTRGGPNFLSRDHVAPLGTQSNLNGLSQGVYAYSESPCEPPQSRPFSLRAS